MLQLMVPGIVYGMTQIDGFLLMPNESPMTMWFMGIAMWWMFAVMAALSLCMQPDKTYRAKLARIRFGRYLWVLPLGAIAMNCYTPFEFYDERIIVFKSLVVTWVGIVLWILVDWYLWNFKPYARQRELQELDIYLKERRAEIDLIPDCVVPSGLNLIKPEDAFLGTIA